MTDAFVEAINTCTTAQRKALAMQAPKHKYVHWGIDNHPGMFNDTFRHEAYERGDVTYAIMHPYQPYDDDSMLVRWHRDKDIWTMSFSLGLGGGEFPMGEQILHENGNDERAGLALLAHFGLIERREEFHPIKLGFMSPWELQQSTKA